MPQGPPPGSFVGHGGAGGIDLSKQTPPHHQTGHHPTSIPPGILHHPLIGIYFGSMY